jgi:hypothetical protein
MAAAGFETLSSAFGKSAAKNIGEAYSTPGSKMSAVEHKVLHAMVGAISGGIGRPDDVAGGAASGAVGAFTSTTVMALTGRAGEITKEAIATAEAQGRHLDQAFVNALIQARLNDLMAFSALTGAAVAHSLGLDPELAMEVGKRQAKENCLKFLAATCLNQYARYLAVRSAIPKDFDERTTAYAKKIQDEEALKKVPASSKKSAKGGSSSSSSSSSGGGKKDDDRDRWKGKTQPKGEPKEWEVKEYDKVYRGDKGKYYRDPKIKNGNKDLYWTKDVDKHGKSYWKLYEGRDDGLHWQKDADRFGHYMLDKHKSESTKFIPWKDLIRVNFK